MTLVAADRGYSLRSAVILDRMIGVSPSFRPVLVHGLGFSPDHRTIAAVGHETGRVNGS